jgi:hypothetical protein
LTGAILRPSSTAQSLTAPAQQVGGPSAIASFHQTSHLTFQAHCTSRCSSLPIIETNKRRGWMMDSTRDATEKVLSVSRPIENAVPLLAHGSAFSSHVFDPIFISYPVFTILSSSSRSLHSKVKLFYPQQSNLALFAQSLSPHKLSKHSIPPISHHVRSQSRRRCSRHFLARPGW